MLGVGVEIPGVVVEAVFGGKTFVVTWVIAVLALFDLDITDGVYKLPFNTPDSGKVAEFSSKSCQK